jgi:hypothetical protein
MPPGTPLQLAPTGLSLLPGYRKRETGIPGACSCSTGPESLMPVPRKPVTCSWRRHCRPKPITGRFLPRGNNGLLRPLFPGARIALPCFRMADPARVTFAHQNCASGDADRNGTAPTLTKRPCTAERNWAVCVQVLELPSLEAVYHKPEDRSPLGRAGRIQQRRPPGREHRPAECATLGHLRGRSPWRCSPSICRSTGNCRRNHGIGRAKQVEAES